MLHLHNKQNKETKESYGVAKNRRARICEPPLTEALLLNFCKARKKTSSEKQFKDKVVIIPCLVIKSAHYIAASQCTYKLEDFHLKKEGDTKIFQLKEFTDSQMDVDTN